ncbi:MAG: DNA mismatch repair protein [Bacteroidales bacterium]|nr:DNA mismatch repair protein [Bacteroidales bacterium]MDP3001970.1 DNA mismatch repair protein [Bacteroidales bacterium]
MTFDIDKQTIRDLELFQEKRNDKSILSVYNRTATIGGRELLYEVFSSPISNLDFLQNRKNEINFFFSNDCFIKLNSGQLDYIEWYLRNQRVPLKDNIIDAAYDSVKNKFKPDSDYHTISEGILHIIRLLNKLDLFIEEAKSFPIPSTLDKDLDKIKNFIGSKSLKKILSQSEDLSFTQINKLDYFFRVSNKNPFREVLDTIYKIDILQTLNQLMKNDGFTLPEYSPEAKPLFEVIDAIHPLLFSPIPNSFTFNHDSNLCFITGPNMSGKSTFLKTMGVMIYLAHLGFPVPAKKFTTSLFDGLFTTINLTDNLNLGYSHFYSEVKRVKDLVIKMNSERNLFIIFDELFRGTNVKDAYDASLMIISALAKIRDNFFLISTHILEVAENLVDKDSIIFRCFESDLIDQQPVYDFKLKEGVSKERIGLIIIKNERIIEILDEIVKKQK